MNDRCKKCGGKFLFHHWIIQHREENHHLGCAIKNRIFTKWFKKRVNNTRIVLNHEDFNALISGKIIDKDGTEILLQDIGYDVMVNLIEKKRENLYDNNKH